MDERSARRNRKTGCHDDPLRGLAVSQCRMRADTHPGPEHQCSTPEVCYIDAALTFRSTFRPARDIQFDHGLFLPRAAIYLDREQITGRPCDDA